MGAMFPTTEVLLRVLIKKISQKTEGFQMGFPNRKAKEAADQDSALSAPLPLQSKVVWGPTAMPQWKRSNLPKSHFPPHLCSQVTQETRD